MSGEITDIVRGAKRKILKVVITSDKDISYLDTPSISIENLSREEIIDKMCANGVWPFIRQKPYDIIINPSDIEKINFYFGI